MQMCYSVVALRPTMYTIAFEISPQRGSSLQQQLSITAYRFIGDIPVRCSILDSATRTVIHFPQYSNPIGDSMRARTPGLSNGAPMCIDYT